MTVQRCNQCGQELIEIEPRFIDTTASEGAKDLKALARKIAAWTRARFVTIRRHRGGSPVFTEAELTARRSGLSAEEYRRKTIRKWLKE